MSTAIIPKSIPRTDLNISNASALAVIKKYSSRVIQDITNAYDGERLGVVEFWKNGIASLADGVSRVIYHGLDSEPICWLSWSTM
jgi:hypothetical protein